MPTATGLFVQLPLYPFPLHTPQYRNTGYAAVVLKSW